MRNMHKTTMKDTTNILKFQLQKKEKTKPKSKKIWFFPLIGVIFGIENKKKKGMY